MFSLLYSVKMKARLFNIVLGNFFIAIFLSLGVAHKLSFSTVPPGDIDDEKFSKLVKKYFSHERTLCVVQAAPEEETFLPKFSLSVVMFSADYVLKNCDNQPTDQDGYVFITSDTDSLETQTIPLLQCFNHTTLKLTTQHILVVHFSTRTSHNLSNFYWYRSYLKKLWESYGIIKIAVLPVWQQLTTEESLVLLTYNPFIAHKQFSANPINQIGINQNPRAVMYERFHNMHGYTLRAVFITNSFYEVTYAGLKESKSLGANPTILFKQALESCLNITFDIYEAPNNNQYGSFEKGLSTGALGELAAGRADLKITFEVLSNANWPETIQNIQIGHSTKYVILVPAPKEVQSWKLFQFILQWQLCAALGLTLLAMSVLVALFVLAHRIINPGQSDDVSYEVASVWRTGFSLSVSRLPRTHSQRLLIAVSSLAGLVVVTVVSAQLFALIKSKPLMPSIKTLSDLQESNLPIFSIVNPHAIMDAITNTSLSKLRANFKTENAYKFKDLFDPKHLNITDHAVLYTDNLLSIVTGLPKNKIFLQYFEIVNEPVLSIMKVFNVPTRSVYFDHFNELSLRLAAGGFFNKWILTSGYKSAKKLEAMSKTDSRSESVPEPHHTDDYKRPLTYSDLEMAFFILYIGLAASVICFIFEICCC